MTSGADAGNALENAIVALQKSNDNVTALITKLRYWPQSALTYEAFTLTLTPGSITTLLGVDPARTRALLRASGNEVYIGKRSVLSSVGIQGYPLPTVTGDEIKNTDEICVIYNPAGAPTDTRVFVLVERNIT